jgi:lysylphosphatidylglycerol synthetase-like protein (DUF2156 family)
VTFDNWPVWKRALTLNVLGLAGVAIGFASSDVKLSPELCVPIAVFTLALLNVLILVVRPHIMANRAAGRGGSFSEAFVAIVRERPLIVLLLINQLIGASQLLAIATTLIQLLIGGHVHSLPNASTINVRMIPVSAFAMTVVAAIWLLSAVGLWRGRSWAWWLAMFLNGLAVVVSLGVELLGLLVLKQHRFSFGWREITASAACIVLLLPVVRNDFRRVRPEVACT